MKLPTYLLATASLEDETTLWVVRNDPPKFIAQATPRNNSVNLHLAFEIDPIPEADLSAIMQEAAMFVQASVNEPVKKGNYSYVTGSRPVVPEFLIVSNTAANYCGVIYTKFPPAIMEIERRGHLVGIIDFNCCRVITADKTTEIVTKALAFLRSLNKEDQP